MSDQNSQSELRNGKIRSRTSSNTEENPASVRDRERSPSVELMDLPSQLTDSPIGVGIATNHFEGSGRPVPKRAITQSYKDSMLMKLNCIEQKVKLFKNTVDDRYC